ncbi:MAG: dethiobiotin synthase [Rhodocyclales bacterium GT-UBC]|nr:MAG: dethiobiotin synthase [Rhodocyclales bacterium GT-UBC]
MTHNAYFLTGTDTEIGKTFITCALLHRASQDGRLAAGLKPVAAGTDAAGRNDDVEQIRAASSVALPPEIVNPYCFKAAIAPHIAAAEEGRRIEFSVIAAATAAARQQAELLIVEGVGGFRVPLGQDGDSADLAVELGLPVILVVGMRLGCINHALLSVEAIAARGLELAGWVANQVAPAMARQTENLATLSALIAAPRLGVVPRIESGHPVEASRFLKFPA